MKNKGYNLAIELLGGLVLIIVGFLTVANPRTVFVYGFIAFGLFLLADGILNIYNSLSHRKDGRKWKNSFFQGLISIIVGITVFLIPTISSALVVYFVGAYAFIRGLSAITAIRHAKSKKVKSPSSRESIEGIISLIIGCAIFISPLFGTTVLMQLVGLYIVFLGGQYLIRSIEVLKKNGIHHSQTGDISQ